MMASENAHPGDARDMTPLCPVRRGDRVRLRPNSGGDIFDMVLRGRTAIVESVSQDIDGVYYLAVVVEDDPGLEMGWLGKPAHRFFFRLEEVEPVGDGEE